MERPTKLKIGDNFIVNQDLPAFCHGGRPDGLKKGTVLTLRENDGSDAPNFLFPELDDWFVCFDWLDPYKQEPEKPKRPRPTIRVIRR